MAIWLDVRDHLVGAVINLYGEDLAVHAHDLDRQLGVKWYNDICENEFDYGTNIPDRAVELYKQLAGPHGKTILRAYQIKHDIKVKENTDG